MKSILNVPFFLIKCEFSFPSDMSVGAKLFIMKALQKKPDLRFTIESLIKDRFLAQSRGV
jgi:serine/threonine protein kinase